MSWIALATYEQAGKRGTALVDNGRLYDLQACIAAGLQGVPAGWAQRGVEAMVREGGASDWLGDAAQSMAALVAQGKVQPLPHEGVRVVAPYVPQRIFCAASNYASHANEMGTVLAAKALSKPYMFLKLANSVVGPDDVVQLPPETGKLDWEVELAAVIGRPCRRVSVEEALDAVAFYTIVNDVTARDLNLRTDYPFKHDWFQGKCHDTFAPFGPWLVPASQIPDPQRVNLRLDVNGEPMQQDSTANMIWSVREQIAYLSTIVTLQPGDVVATGTPTGVGMGRGIFLKAGDRMVASIEGIGSIANAIEAESV
ncbi:fumarylacetoacetate hydrolase family protein [Hydrogenophaga sp. BPS33]|uniref:fumarylacetoacetate hydrolase family protein n=1 Tax=Hydrogenophaga sp. BPS33 TaxID=2651974 RepID=UPI00131F9E19|nr:fumarylacetoacetate hydrolase family protein [Hydrogenophaga sp. BPS33]QHE86556.1 fumarylacetoacetate hydrolase family protein [Hydrogenophaga sp. BPS33]